MSELTPKPENRSANASVSADAQAPTYTQPIHRNGSVYKKEYYAHINSQDPTWNEESTINEQIKKPTISIERGEVFDKKCYIVTKLPNWSVIRNNDLRDFISPVEFYEEVRKGAIGYRVNWSEVKMSEATTTTTQVCTKTVNNPSVHFNSKMPEPYMEIANVKTPNTILPAYVRTGKDNYRSNSILI